MKAVAYRQALSIDNPDALLDITLPEPEAAGHDLLVEVKAIAVNPVDTKVRKNMAPAVGEARVLGWDAAGIVRAVGGDVTLFKPGDRVWYAGALTRPGSNAELQLVDERIVGRMPQSLDFAHAAALPLTTITAWELLFDRLQVTHGEGTGDAILIVGAAGGVGSILTQLARRVTELTVIGSASRPETAQWITALGAHHVIDHSKPLHEELKRIGIPAARYIAGLTHTDAHLPNIVEAIAPQGRLAVIDDPVVFDINPFKRKSVSVHWEFMFTRSMFETPDMIEQHRILTRTAELIDAGTLKTTFGEHFGTINATNLKRAHALLESGRAKGKIVLEGF